MSNSHRCLFHSWSIFHNLSKQLASFWPLLKCSTFDTLKACTYNTIFGNYQIPVSKNPWSAYVTGLSYYLALKSSTWASYINDKNPQLFSQLRFSSKYLRNVYTSRFWGKLSWGNLSITQAWGNLKFEIFYTSGARTHTNLVSIWQHLSLEIQRWYQVSWWK